MAYEAPDENMLKKEQLKLDIYTKAQPIIGRLKKAGVDVGEFETELNGLLPNRELDLKSGITAAPKMVGGVVSNMRDGKSFGDALGAGADILRKEIEPLAMTSRKVITDYVDTAKDFLNMPKIETPERKLNEIQYKQSMATNPVSTIVRDIGVDPSTYVMPSSKLLQAESKIGRFAKGATVNAPIVGGSYSLREGGKDDFSLENALIATGAGGLLGGLLNIPFGKIAPKAKAGVDMSDEEKARRMMGDMPSVEVVKPFNQQVMNDWAKFQNGEMSLEELHVKYQQFQKQLPNKNAINLPPPDGWKQPLGNRIQEALDAKSGNEISQKNEFFSTVDRLANENKTDEFNALMNGLADETRQVDEALNLPPKQIGVSELDSLVRKHLGYPLSDVIGSNGQTVKTMHNPLTEAQTRASKEAQRLFDNEIAPRANDNLMFNPRAGFTGSPVANTIVAGGTGSTAPIDYNQDGEVSMEERGLSALLASVGVNIPSLMRNAGKTMQKAKEAPSGMRNGMITNAEVQEATGIPQELEKFGRNFAQFKNKPDDAIAHLMDTKNGQVRGAFYNKDLGEIDLVWGQNEKIENQNKGFGLKHIYEARKDQWGEERALAFIKRLPEIIQDGVARKTNIDGRYEIINPKSTAIVELEYNKEDKRWLVTAYKDSSNKNKFNQADDLTIYGERPNADEPIVSNAKDGTFLSSMPDSEILPQSTNGVNNRTERTMEWHQNSHPLTKNEDGTPKVFYHGTAQNFDTFDVNKIGSSTDSGVWGSGFYFGSEPNIANFYSQLKTKEGSNVMPVYIKMKNPFILTKESKKSVIDKISKEVDDVFESTTDYSNRLKEGLIKRGYDGVVDTIGDHNVAFDPTQIKSIHNRGTFDETDPNILRGFSVPTVGAGMMATSEQLKADDGSMSPLGNALALAGAGALAYKFGGKALDVANKVGSKAITSTAKAMDDLTANRISKTWDNFTSNRIVDAFLGTKIYKLDDYMKMRGDYTKSLNPTLETLEKLHVQLAEFSPQTREAMYDYMTGVKGVQLPTNLKKLADGFTKEIDTLSQELVKYGALTQEQANAFKGQYLHRQYTSKMKDLFSFGGDRKTLSDVKHRGRAWEGSEAEYNTYLRSGALGDFVDGKIVAQQQANGKYKFYQDWSPEQRAKWGEVKDVAFSIPETMSMLHERLENAKFLNAIAGDARYVAPKTMSHEDAISNGYVKLEGKRYGQLSGKYVIPEIASDIKAFADVIHGSDGQFAGMADAWKKAVSYLKSTHTIYSPTAHVNNLMSNLTFQFAEGVNNPIKMVANFTKGAIAHRKANELLRLEAIAKVRNLTPDETKSLSALSMDDDVLLYKEAKLKGLFGKSQLNDTLNQYIKPRTQYKDGLVTKIHQKAGNIYGAEDDMMRFSLLKTLKEMNPNQSIDTLIDRVNNTIPDYSKPMSSVARKLRDTGFVPFIGFTYHAMPIMLRQMKERPVSVAALAGMMGVIYAANDINPLSDEDMPDEGYAFKRLPIMQNGNIVTTIKVDKWIPHYDMLSSMTDFSQGVIPEFARSQLVGGIPQNLVGGLINYNPYFNQRVTQKEGAQKAYQLGKYNVQQATPDILDNAYNLAESKLLDTKTRRYNKVIEPRSTWQEVAKNFGVNIQSYNKAEQSRKSRNERVK